MITATVQVARLLASRSQVEPPRLTFSYLPPEQRRITLLVHPTGRALSFIGEAVSDTLVSCGEIDLDEVMRLRDKLVRVHVARTITKRQRRREARLLTRGRRGARRVPLLIEVTDCWVESVTASFYGMGVWRFRIGLRKAQPPHRPFIPGSALCTPPPSRPAPPGSSPPPP